MSGQREAKAFFFAIPAASIVASISFAVFGTILRTKPLSADYAMGLIKVVAAYSIFMLPFVAVGGVLVGLPVAFALRRLGVDNLFIWLFIGMIAGGTFSLIILGFLAVHFTSEVAFWAFSIGTFPGLVASWVWWHTAEKVESSDVINA